MRKLFDGQSGFTLVEVIVAYVVLIITAMATCSAFVIGSRFNATSEDRTVAANIAQLKLEEMKNTHYRFIVYNHPAGEALFTDEPQAPPYWTLSSEGEWLPSLPEGKYEISYPGLDLANGIIPNPLVAKVTVSWKGNTDTGSSPNQEAAPLSLKTIFSIVPGRMMIR